VARTADPDNYSSRSWDAFSAMPSGRAHTSDIFSAIGSSEADVFGGRDRDTPRAKTTPAGKPEVVSVPNVAADWGIFVDKGAGGGAIVDDTGLSKEERNKAAAAELFEAGLVAIRKGDLHQAAENWEHAIALDETQRTYRSNLKLLHKRMAKDS
ncbi:MAG: hypothetical protein JRH20_18315, partial [Deltaproteobacteria bacterium]|nr:hypothetical protein [Deltaproteobacteria bacterium]